MDTSTSPSRSGIGIAIASLQLTMLTCVVVLRRSVYCVGLSSLLASANRYTTVWYINNEDIVGVTNTSTDPLLSGPYLSWLGDFLTYFVLYNNFIPISLYVTLEICNFCQALWINNDAAMYV